MLRSRGPSKKRVVKEGGALYQAEPVLRLTKVTRHGQVTLPSDVRRMLGIEEGDVIEITVEGERVMMTPKKLIDKSQAYFWTERWQAAEREAEEDIRAGRVKTFRSVDELVRELERE